MSIFRAITSAVSLFKPRNTGIIDLGRFWDDNYSSLGVALKEGFLSNPGYAARPSFLARLAEAVETYSPLSVLEVGTGLTTQLLIERLPRGAKIFTIDENKEWQKTILDSCPAQEGMVTPLTYLTEDALGIGELLISVSEKYGEILPFAAMIIDGPSKVDRFPVTLLEAYVKYAASARFVMVDDVDREANLRAAEYMGKETGKSLTVFEDDIQPKHKFAILS
jgi:hypothetical protein